MNTIATYYRSCSKPLDLAAKISAILLAFAIPVSTTATDILIICAAGFSLLSGRWFAERGLLARHRIAFLFILFFLLFVIGLIYTPAPLDEALEMVSKYDKFIYAVLLIPIFTEQAWRRYAILSFLCAMLLTLCLTYTDLWGWTHFSQHTGIGSVFKGHIEANFLTAVFTYFVLQEIVHKKTWRWFWVLILPFVVYSTLFLSMGRDGYFVFALLVLLFMWQQWGWKGVSMAFVGILLLSALAFQLSPVFHGRITSVKNNLVDYESGEKNTSVGLRLVFATNSLRLIKENPLIGVGTAGYGYAVRHMVPTPIDTRDNPHNEYFNIAVQFGLIGLAVLLLMFYCIWRDSHDLPDDMKQLAQAVLLAIMFGCLGNSWLMDTTQGHFFVYFIALTFAARPSSSQ